MVSFEPVPIRPLESAQTVHASTLVANFLEVVSCFPAAGIPGFERSFACAEPDQYYAAVGHKLGSRPLA